MRAPWATPLDRDPDMVCPRCKGSGSERDMELGQLIVCRDCSGSGWRDDEFDDEKDDEDG